MMDKKIFIIEDDPSISKLLEDTLKENGYIVDKIATGEGAFEKVLTGEYDLIILDLLLPKKSGIEVLEELKSNDKTKSIPVIIISALDRDEFFMNKGAIDFFKKPIDLDYFMGRINSILIKDRNIDRKVKVAIIEDDVNLSNLLKDILESHNFEVYTAFNGKEGLEIIEIEKPELVILDLEMPVMDGFKLLSVLKNEIKERNLKIVIVTGLIHEGIKKLCMELGSNAFIRKPFDIQVLTGIIKGLLK